MRTVICVVAHAGDQDVFDRNFHLWKRHNGWNIIVLSPEDSPVKVDRKFALTFPSKDEGMNHIRRWGKIFSALSTMKDVDRFVIFEPDSFCLSPKIPRFYAVGEDRVKHFDVPMLVGNVMYGPPTHRKVSSSHYVLHPLILTRSGAELLSEAWRAIPEDCEGGHSDRAIYRLSQQSGVRIVDFHRYGLGYAQIRVFPSEYIAMQEAIIRGARMIHGVKEKHATDIVTNAMNAKLHWPQELPVVDDMTACWIPGPFYGYLLKDLDSDFREWFMKRDDLQEQFPELAIGLRQL